MKRIIIILFIIGVFGFITSTIFAHQPRLVKEDIIEIKNPEVSQAFYAELVGTPQIYYIQSENDFSLYVGLLVPDIPNIETDVSAIVREKDYEHESSNEHNNFEVLLDGNTHEWTPYYEEHAGDDYFTGPALQAKDSDPTLHPKGVAVSAGEYEIEVFSSDNTGKYVLVVGEKEEFPLREIINTVLQVPQIKAYFGKSVFSAFSTPTMLGFLFTVVILAAIIIALIVFLVRKIYK
ncbi:MAG: hypothetical protein ISR98_00385 [Parcubacteria group bacterium]|nr:hypothetical protein [Parcubacteria group bacterium]